MRWLEDSEALAAVIETKKDNADFVVITCPEYMDQAMDLFGQERVFTAKQMKGLQAKEVLLYRFFEQDGFVSANKDLPKGLALERDAHTITKESQGSVRHSTLFNELFVACTRAESTLIFYQPNIHAIQNVTGPLKGVVANLALRTNLATQEPVVSSKEDWLARAKVLREHGQEAQAKAIEARFVTPLVEQSAEAVSESRQVAFFASEAQPEPGTYSHIKKVAKKVLPFSAEAVSDSPSAAFSAPRASAEKSAKIVAKKVLKLSVEHELELIFEALVAGDASKINMLLTFPFQQLDAYKGFTPDQQVARNLPAVTLMDYFAHHNLTVMNPPAPLVTALITYLEEIRAWKRLDEKQQGRQDAFMSLLYYRSAITPLPLAISVIKKLSKDSEQRKFIETFKQQRLETFNKALSV